MDKNKRKEQIDNASYEYTGEYTNSDFHFGAEWADSHPREGLWDRNKICAFIKSLLTDTEVLDTYRGVMVRGVKASYTTVEELIEDLRKTMEGE